MRAGLTRMQRLALNFIMDRHAAGESPTFDEIAAHLGLHSKSGVARLVEALVERGHLVRFPGRARSLAPAPEADVFTVTLPEFLRAWLRKVEADLGRSPEDVIVSALAYYRWALEPSAPAGVGSDSHGQGHPPQTS